MIDLSEAGPVPVGAEFVLNIQFENGLPESDFLRRWGPFTAVIEFDGGRASHTYERPFIQSQIDAQNPYLRPHVTRRKQ